MGLFSDPAATHASIVMPEDMLSPSKKSPSSRRMRRSSTLAPSSKKHPMRMRRNATYDNVSRLPTLPDNGESTGTNNSIFSKRASGASLMRSSVSTRRISTSSNASSLDASFSMNDHLGQMEEFLQVISSKGQQEREQILRDCVIHKQQATRK
ncbi:hypothetical protein SEMRO_297_G110930.1 [Seminavis robusta]|uniref:Uncharacterized protein n=1 Tax=Seminavis robusta TaxID=568900 RepID=A0A9N8DRD6_9STRA|nr:hypothetical protein SEMRO_297_G110930.1 [Seminavis robusta]|eukprot:Sro297_g110930.1 n/a (153) ;mRNA; r:46877-47335